MCGKQRTCATANLEVWEGKELRAPWLETRIRAGRIREQRETVGIPHPGCFGKRVWICLIPKELTFLATTKRLQEYGNKGVGANCRRELVEVTQARVPQIWT